MPETKVRTLLAALLVYRRQFVSTDLLIQALWGENPPARSGALLHTKIWRLRGALNEAGSGVRDLLEHQSSGYRLQVPHDLVDADLFCSLTARARQAESADSKRALLAQALELWRGDPFTEVRDALFVQAEITRLREEHAHAREEHADARLTLGEARALLGDLGGLVAQYPLRERARAVQIRALCRAGRQAEALESFADLQLRLRHELGADPGPELMTLQQALLSQDITLQPSSGRDSVGAGRCNLPVPASRLVGRTTAVAEVCSLLAESRMVTLTGPGGVGKTHLGLEVSRNLVDGYPDGAWLVELAALCESEDGTSHALAAAVMSVLGVREGLTVGPDPSARSPAPIERLVSALRGRELLLVLDSCEHVGPQVAELSATLLRSLPGLRILATSLEPVGVSGEVLWRVPPLETPEQTARPDPVSLERHGAVRLFLERAAAAAPGFALDTENAESVATLVRRLDGIPLALELAATRIRALGLHELTARLDERLRLLVSGSRDTPDRHRTLRATIEWSWELLGATDRAVMRRLAVHREDCTLRAAEGVCAGAEVAAEDVLESLARLVDASLLVTAEGPSGLRYRMLESVALFCFERLMEADEYDSTRRRHVRYYARFADEAGARLCGDDQEWWLDCLDTESANVRSAFECSVEHGDAETALRLANATMWYLFLRGRLSEARRVVDMALATGGGLPSARARGLAWQASLGLLEGTSTDPVYQGRASLALYEELDDPLGRARAQWLLGFATEFGDLTAGEKLVERALATFRELGDRWGVAAALSTRAKQAMARGDLETVRHDGERSLALFRELGDVWGQAQAMEWLGALAEITGEYERARHLHREGLRITEDLGLWPQAADRLSWLGRVTLLRGDHNGATELHERALRLAVEHSYKPGEIFAEVGLGMGARAKGNLDEAETHLRGVLRWYCQLDVTAGAGLAEVFTELGFVAEQRGDVATCWDLHAQGFRVAHQLGDSRSLALALEGAAGALVLGGDRGHAVLALGAANTARAEAGTPVPPGGRRDAVRIRARVRRELGEEEFTRWFEFGAALWPEHAYAAVAPDAPGSDGGHFHERWE